MRFLCCGVVEPELVFGCLEAILDRPAMALDADQGALASAQYEKTPAQVDKIESYLNAAVRAAVARLRGEAEGDNTIEI